jgi:hypothetical protein
VELQFRPLADNNAEDAQPGDSMVRMTTRLELGSLLAVLAILLSLAGHASAQQAGGQAPAVGTVPKQAAPKAAANSQDGGDATKPPPVKLAGNFGQWALVGAEPTSKDDMPPCNLVQALVDRGRVAEGPRILARCGEDLSLAVPNLRSARL